MSYRKNIAKLYYIRGVRFFLLYMPIIIPFYMSFGLSMSEIMVLQASYSLAVTLLEVPSGYISDRIGMRKTILLGTILGSIGFSMYATMSGFWLFMAAQLIMGVGHSMISGADSALLYDSLSAERQTNRYLKYEGRTFAIANVSEASAALIGAPLAALSFRYPYFGQLLIAASAIPIAYSLVEPPRDRSKAQSAGFAASVWQAMRRPGPMTWFLFLGATAGVCTLTVAWIVQPWFISGQLDLIWFGWLWAGLNLSVAPGSILAHRLTARLRPATVIIGMALMLAGTAALGMPYALITLWGFYVFRGIASPYFKDLLQHHIPDGMRATVLSIRSLFIRLGFVVLGPVLGVVTDTWGIAEATWLAMLALVVPAAICIIGISRSRKAMAAPD